MIIVALFIYAVVFSLIAPVHSPVLSGLPPNWISAREHQQQRLAPRVIYLPSNPLRLLLPSPPATQDDSVPNVLASEVPVASSQPRSRIHFPEDDSTIWLVLIMFAASTFGFFLGRLRSGQQVVVKCHWPAAVQQPGIEADMAANERQDPSKVIVPSSTKVAPENVPLVSLVSDDYAEPLDSTFDTPRTPTKKEELVEFIAWTLASRLRPSIPSRRPLDASPNAPTPAHSSTDLDESIFGPSSNNSASGSFTLFSPRAPRRDPTELATPSGIDQDPELDEFVLEELAKMEQQHASAPASSSGSQESPPANTQGEESARISVLEAAKALELKAHDQGRGKGKAKAFKPASEDLVVVGRVAAVVREWARQPPKLVADEAWKRLRPEEELVSGTAVPSGGMRSIDSILGDMNNET
ncbi:hypothetical protein B0H19DRAFT_1234096 [Mycena capillaripes]|nr:hypothetical protein B0H19DRAFT_1234096 [Mycena capillaripes]